MLKPGMFISDRYEIIDKVGSGGMADVYKARCHRLNRFVAIKVLKAEYSDDKNFVKKFRGEAQSAAGLSHPNIVNVYDVGDDNGLHYIVMELVEGITLKNFIERKGKLEVKEAVGIAIQIAMGMEAAHTNHIIHRDIKPQNIIISREGKVKVTDFGIAKATNSNTITSNAMGSVHYLSPEQARGGYSDEKSDIYSLGVTLYEMLSGKVPFAGDNTVSVALLHIQGEATPLREIDPNIPISVDRIVQKCMQKKPERRYLSASDLITDLKRSISNPNGDFVVISNAVVSDSPTITISEDEVNHIKSASKIKDTGYDTSKDIFQNTDGRRTGDTTQLTNEDEEDLDSVDPRVEKIVMIGSIAAGVILTILVIFFVVKFFKLLPGSDKPVTPNTVQTTVESTETTSEETTSETVEVTTITMPPVIGLTLQDAEDTLQAKSDKLQVTYDEEPSDTVKKGMVIEQYPLQGVEVEANAEVKLTISSGPEAVEIPNVYNSSDDQAVTILEEAGFKVKHEYAYSDEIEEGRVISTTPERGTTAYPGDTITVVISNGPENTDVTVPNIVGLTQKKATKALTDAGLKAGDITSDYSDSYSKGQVVYQNYDNGTKIAKGTAVDFTVSLGPDTSGDSGSQSYVGSVTIDENPFEYAGDNAIVEIELIQDGNITTLKKTKMSYDSFPLTIDNITSTSDSTGTVQMFIGREVDKYEDGVVTENGVMIKYEQYETSWTVDFTPVGD
jgi:eukaryotic-like serine/threonine-protein kinase